MFFVECASLINPFFCKTLSDVMFKGSITASIELKFNTLNHNLSLFLQLQLHNHYCKIQVKSYSQFQNENIQVL